MRPERLDVATPVDRRLGPQGRDHRRSALSVEAGTKYFLVGALTNTLLLAGVTVLFGAAGTTLYVDTAVALGASTAAMTGAFVGIPPLAGFTGKLLLFTAMIDAGFAWLAAIAVANTVVSLFYYLRVVAALTLDESRGPVPVLGRWASAGTAVAAVLVVGLGLGAQALLHAASHVRSAPQRRRGPAMGHNVAKPLRWLVCREAWSARSFDARPGVEP